MQRRTGNRNVDKIEDMFRREQELSDAILESKIGTHGHTGGTPTGHTYISDPTAISAIRRAVELDTVTLKDGTRIFKPEKWLEVIHAVKEWCAKDTLKEEVYKRRYLKRESYVATCSDIHVVQQTYSLLLWDIRNFALQCAAQAQLIRVY